MKIFRYEITDSTNTRAKEYAKEASSLVPAVFVADSQSAGRGRRGRTFDSEGGAGLYMSILFRPTKQTCDAAKITVRAAVATVRALKKICGISASIKWVNDIYFDGKKLAGILTEGEITSDGTFSYAVCGIGLNLLSRTFPDEIKDRAIALEDITGTRVDRDLLMDEIIREFFAECDYREIIEEYRAESTVIGKRVLMKRLSGEEFFATVLELTDGGALLVLRDDGEREELISAEVSVIL